MTQALPSVGFVILSHEADVKLPRLIAALDREYGTPAIVVHHDFGQASLDTGAFGANVRFVKPSIKTAWAKWSLVEAALLAIGQLYRDGGPDWFFLLSTADYPIASGSTVRRELARSECDAFIDARPLVAGSRGLAAMTGDHNPKLDHFDTAENVRLKWRFYLSRQFWVPIIRLKPRFRVGRFTYRSPIMGAHPFHAGFKCFYGDQWFTANRKAAQILISPDRREQALQAYYRGRTQADESYYCTVLANRRELTLCRDNRRFAEWNGGGAHPMLLTEAQVPEMLASGAFFARKIVDARVIARIDEALAVAEPV